MRFEYFDHLGFFSPYLLESGSNTEIFDDFEDALEAKDDRNEIHIPSLVSILTNGFALGDETLVNNLRKTRWMTKWEGGRWVKTDYPKFGHKKASNEEIGKSLFKLLKKEILTFVKDHNTVGLLLTGGMDSRMAAGVLDCLIKDGDLVGVKVVALTWGDEQSRDSIYARKIAKRLNWDWKGYSITSELLARNILTTAERGAEFSPTHLHGMSLVSEESGIDVILAASFGDSLGRGEYSGRTIGNLRDIRYRIRNSYGILSNGVIKGCSDQIDKSVVDYWSEYPQKEHYQQLEQDYQIHYMRRMLNPCMSVIHERIPTRQLFSSPELVNYMWSLDPACRNNDAYKVLLNLFETDLKDIPWAKTGLVYDHIQGSPDPYRKSHTDYSAMLRTDLLNQVEEEVLSDVISELRIFNTTTLERVFKLLRSKKYIENKDLEEMILWIASLSGMVRKYKLINSSNSYSENLFSSLNSLRIDYKNQVELLKRVYYGRNQ